MAGRKQVNTINDYMRQTGELARRHPHLREQIEEMERQFLMKTGRSEEIVLDETFSLLCRLSAPQQAKA